MISIQGRLQGGLQGRIDTQIYQKKKNRPETRRPKTQGPKDRPEARAPKITNTRFIHLVKVKGEI